MHKHILKLVNFSLTAFGDAHDGPLISSMALHGPWKCPGGHTECEVDTVINCVLQKYGPKLGMTFVRCLMIDGAALMSSVGTCKMLPQIQDDLKKWDEVQQCTKGSAADDMMAYAQLVTTHRAGDHQYIPWVVVDGKNLPCVGGVCDVLAAVCEELMKKGMPHADCKSEYPPLPVGTHMPTPELHPVQKAVNAALKYDSLKKKWVPKDHVKDYSPVLEAAGIHLPPAPKAPKAKPSNAELKQAFKAALKHAQAEAKPNKGSAANAELKKAVNAAEKVVAGK